MKLTEIGKLKLNAKKIKGSLFRGNRELVKLKKDRIKLFNFEENKKKISKKESLIESKTSFLQSVTNVGKRLVSGPLSLIDKFKEFFGLILLGILVNNLPTIIKKLQEVFTKIKTFLDQNPWIMEVIKIFSKITRTAIVELAKFLKTLQPVIGGSFKFALDTIRGVKQQVGSLIQTFNDIDNAVNGLLKFFGIGQTQQPQSQQQSSRNRQYQGPGGAPSGSGQGQFNRRPAAQRAAQKAKATPAPAYDPNTGTTKLGNQQKGYVPKILAPRGGVMGAMEPGNPNTWAELGNDPRLNPSIQRYNAVKNAEKFAAGGTIKPEQSTRNKPETTKISAPTAKTPFARPGGTAKGRKARQAVNAFGLFKRNVDDQSLDVKNQEKNYNFFEELLNKFKELQGLKEVEKEGVSPGGGGGADGGGGGDGGMIPGEMAPEVKAMLEAISAGEGGWDSVNPRTTVSGLSNMTIAQARNAAIQKGIREKGGSGAMGKWQQMPEFILSRARSAGLDPNKDKFNQENQTKIARMLMASVYPGGELQLIKDAKQDPLVAASKLRGTWPSLPGGSQQNTDAKQFRKHFAESIKKYQPMQYVTPDSKTKLTVTSRRGWRFMNGGLRYHQGTDIATNQGTPLRAISDGEIVERDVDSGGWGNYIVMKDDKGIYHLYGHLANGSVRGRGKVKKGDIVGRVGMTGRTTGPHLHWESGTGHKGGGILQGYFDPLNRYSVNAPFFTRREEKKELPKPTSTTSLPLVRPAKTKADLIGSVSSLPTSTTIPQISPGPKSNNLVASSTLNRNMKPNTVILYQREIIT